MKKYKNTNNRDLKKWAVIFLCSSFVSVALLLGIIYCFFYPADKETEIITIPNFVGMSEAEILNISTFTIEKEWVYSSEADTGRVISQSPYAMTRRKLKKGEKYPIRLTVSLGGRRLEVPELVGKPCLSAAALLRELGVSVRTVNVFDSEYDNDIVVGTSPEKDQKINVGQTVTLFVSKKRVESSVKVRNFIGRKQEDACLEILGDGLFVGELQVEQSERPEGEVIWQSLAEGAYVQNGTYIDLVISGGADVEQTPPQTEQAETVTEEMRDDNTEKKPKRKFWFFDIE